MRGFRQLWWERKEGVLALFPSQQLMTGLLCGRQELPSGPRAELGGVLHIILPSQHLPGTCPVLSTHAGT